MILVDANILLYAYDSGSPHHRQAARWLEGALTDRQPIRLAWITVLAFLRVSTNARLLSRPLLTDEAVSIVESWLDVPSVGILEPGERHWSILKRVLSEGRARGPLVSDAYLAALALEHGATICSSDLDFSRFASVRVLNPLHAAPS